MRKVIITAALVTFGSLALVGSSPAALVQQSQVKIVPTIGSGTPQGLKNVALDAYLSTRDGSSVRGTKKANPVGTVFMDFPTGTTVNKSAAPTCNQSEYQTPANLASLCSSSVIGIGWALLNTAEATSREQLIGPSGSLATPTTCAKEDATQYTRTWQSQPEAGPDCVPFGDIWVRIVMYQGGILKNQWWCYGTAGAPRGGAACNNKQAGADATGKLYNKFNDTTNASKTNGCNIIFSNENSVAPLAFGGSVNQCKNRLTVIIPAMNGTGAGLGELTGGYVLSDFYTHTVKATYMKAGKCSSKKFTVSADVRYGQFKGESTPPSPASTVTKFVSACN